MMYSFHNDVIYVMKCTNMYILVMYTRGSVYDVNMIYYVISSICKPTHCNTLQHTATHCNTLQHTATHCTYNVHIIYCIISDIYVLHSNTLQHTAHKNVRIIYYVISKVHIIYYVIHISLIT